MYIVNDPEVAREISRKVVEEYQDEENSLDIHATLKKVVLEYQNKEQHK